MFVQGGRRLLQANLTEISPDPVSAAVELSPFGPDDPSATTADDEDTEGAEGTTPTDGEAAVRVAPLTQTNLGCNPAFCVSAGVTVCLTCPFEHVCQLSPRRRRRGRRR